jgi:hypothetical protein
VIIDRPRGGANDFDSVGDDPVTGRVAPPEKRGTTRSRRSSSSMMQAAGPWSRAGRARTGGQAGRPGGGAARTPWEAKCSIATSSGALTLAVDEASARGSYEREGRTLSFSSVEVSPGLFEVQIDVNGMILDAYVDHAGGVANLDAFAATDASDTQIVDDDREILYAFYRALNDEVDDSGWSEAAFMLRRVVGLWSEHPTTLDPERLIMGEEGRGCTMLCSYAYCGSWSGSCSYWNWYYYSDHDCCRNWWGTDCHGFNDPDGKNQQRAQLGDHYSCSGDEWYWNGSSWVCGEPDHWSRPYVVGNCFGRVGASCGGDRQDTVDGANHDGCVRNGHDLASLYCDDQFTAASDDELFAPNCY